MGGLLAQERLRQVKQTGQIHKAGRREFSSQDPCQLPECQHLVLALWYTFILNILFSVSQSVCFCFFSPPPSINY